MIYHHIALNTPLGLLTYRHNETLAIGTRVVVTLVGKKQVGIVWASGITPDIDIKKILPISEILADDFKLPENWFALIEFASRYYHYPLGQTAFTALPQAFKEAQSIHLPVPPLSYRLNELGAAQTPPAARFHKKVALWQALLSGSLNLAELKKIHAQAADLIETYQQNGWLDVQSTPARSPEIPLSPFVLNHNQQIAVNSVKTVSQFQTFLLHGITGSGKTEVYFDIAAKVLTEDKQVLFLLPEINLTPQLLRRIATRFPNLSTAVLHSQTTITQRSRDYLRAMTGEARLIIGTRLAVFTPLANVGLIVVDEEHDTSFKQDNELRYNARDLAIWRAQQADCPIVLGSATPALESWHKAQTGAYHLLSLPKRAHNAARPPVIHILDIRKQTLNNGIAPQIEQLLQKNWQAGGLSLVYLNRRGFAPALFCGDCGHTFSCRNCSAKLVLHRRASELRCHHCDFRQPVARACPSCGNQDLSALGEGTQRIEETLRKMLPQARIARVDRDSTTRKNDWDDLYAQIDSGSIDILIGTQMLAKGHDFARLNLVTVLNADGALFSSDFRAPERLFAELMQVSGRAGRANQTGEVWIQTRLPEHPLFAAVQAQDYARFAAESLGERAPFALPPFGFQAAIRADAPQMVEALAFLNDIKNAVSPMLPENVVQMGALPMSMARLAERERAQLFLESRNRKDLHRALSLWQQALIQNRESRIRWHIDVDTQEM
ncbi:MAG: primosomal protein N' [Alysiella sp.]|uniref:primosomal protein N' n=1 Tax=Alysiella sp. TaxID=1872483 RepID=UPI0026DAE2E1|nr:primosomal protein N' [Alysiella sp.]MDO4434235.1 primosomal protein N' [Alysiella sp.]